LRPNQLDPVAGLQVSTDRDPARPSRTHRQMLRAALLALAMLFFAPMAQAQAPAAEPDEFDALDAVEAETAEDSADADDELFAGDDESDELEPDFINDPMEELIVTATKRKQSVQDVPVSVTALGGQFLEDTGTTNFSELQKFVPNLQILPVTDTRSTSIRIRGIGSVGTNAGIDPSVGVFIDGVYQGRAGMSVQDLLDIERVEVLRGPQGTLYGKNTAAGAINIITKNPTDDFEAFGESVVGNYNAMEFRGSMNGPIVPDILSARVAGYKVLRDGYDVNRYNNELVNDSDKWGIRGKLLWTATDDIDVMLSGDYAVDASKCCVGDIITYQGPGNLGVTFDDLAAVTGIPPEDQEPNADGTMWGPGDPVRTADPFDRIVGANTDPQNRVTVGGIALDYNQEVWSDHSLRWLTAYRTYTSDSQFDGDFSVYDAVFSRTEVEYYQVSSELLLVSPGGETFEYQTGLYFFHSSLDTDDVLGYSELFATTSPLPLPPDSTNLNINEHNTFSAAGFGQVTWNIVETVSLTGGFRLDYENKSRYGNSTSTCDVAAPPVCGPDDERDEKRDVWSPQGTIIGRYRPTDDVMVYASFSNGFKSGGFNQLRTSADLSGDPLQSEFDDERSFNYELGTKTTWIDGSLLMNLTGYFTDYRDFQAQTFDGSSIIVDNAGGLYSSGIETELRWVPDFFDDRNLVLGGSLGLNYTWYNDYPRAPATLPQNEEASTGATPPFPPDLSAFRCSSPAGTVLYIDCSQDLGGKRLDNAPRVSLTLFSAYEHEIPGTDFIWYASGNYLYETFKYLDVDLDPALIQDPIHLLGLRTGFKLNDDRLDVSFWVENTLDQGWLVMGADVPIVSGYMGVNAPPRTFGGTFRVRF